MQNYYDILGITQTASDEQIKAAFRRLAKLYHPDKNPQGKEEFAKILLAYETLINNLSRRQYDSKLKYGTIESAKTKKSNSKQKEWGFSDEELKRRQYYKEHYKKEYERHAKTASVPRTNYNEYKYILFAAPLAVGLLMFIVNTYEQSDTEGMKSTTDIVILPKKEGLKMTDDPFTSYFKNPIFDSIANRNIVVKNFSSKDIVMALFNSENKFLRSAVIKSGFYVEVQQLPNTDINVKIVTGIDWNRQKEHSGLDVIGGFNDNETFCVLNTKETNGYTITLDEATLAALDKISVNDFFKRD